MTNVDLVETASRVEGAAPYREKKNRNTHTKKNDYLPNQVVLTHPSYIINDFIAHTIGKEICVVAQKEERKQGKEKNFIS